MEIMRKVIERAFLNGRASQLVVDMLDSALEEALCRSFKADGGTVVAGPDGHGDGGVLELANLDFGLLDERTRRFCQRVAPGAPMVVIHQGGTEEHHLTRWVELQKARLQMSKAHGEAFGDRVVIVGTRRVSMDSSTRKKLRGMAHRLEPSVLVGRGGLTEMLITALNSALTRHGLVKFRLTPQCELDKVEAIESLAAATGAELVQRVGRTGVLRLPGVALDPPVSRGGRRRG